MKIHSIPRAVLVLVSILGCAAPEKKPEAPAISKEMAGLLAGLTSNDPAVRAVAAANAPQLGVTAIPLIRAQAFVPALPDQIRSVQLAYIAFVTDALRPSNENKRAAVSAALLDVLDTDLPGSLRTELFRQLGLVVNDGASISRIAKLLERDDSRDGARRALEMIANPDAERALIAALATATPNRKADIARSLGRRQALSAAAPLSLLAQSKNPVDAAAAREALARIGDAQSKDLLLAALDPTKNATVDDLLIFAERRAAQGDTATAEAIYGKLLTDAPAHHRAAAALGLAQVEASLSVPVKENVDALVHALADDDAEVRVAAEHALCTLKGVGTVALVRDAFWQGDAALRPAVLRILFVIDPQPQDALTAGLRDPIASVRAEAMRLAAPTASAADAKEFLKIAKDETGEERDVAHAACLVVAEARIDANESMVALDLLRELGGQSPSPSVSRELMRLVTRAGEPSALEWIDMVATDPSQRDDVARTKIALGSLLAKQDKGIGLNVIEQAYLGAQSTSVRRSALDRVKNLGGDPSSLLRKAGFLADWQILGPMKHATNDDFESNPFAAGVDLAASVDGKNGKVSWRALDTSKFDGIINLKALIEPSDDCAAYGYCEFDADQGPAQLKVGSDDGCAVWLNGDLVLAKNVDRAVRIDDDSVDVNLKAGKNVVLIKVNQGNGDYGFCVRVAPGAGAKTSP